MKKLTLTDIKNCELGILIDFSQFCDKNNLCYVLAGGSLLGAVRHKGFIPWDDDIDVMMPREDYERFFKINECEKIFEIRSITDGSGPIPFAKLLVPDTVIDSKYSDMPNTNSLWIDVFPIDGLPASEKQVEKIYLYARFLRKCHSITVAKFGTGTTIGKKIGKLLLYYPLKLIGSYRFAQWIDRYCQKIKFSDSEYIGGISWGYGPQERMPKKEWLERVKVEFEGHEFWAPGCWDLYLRNLYGDYMKLPPEEKRINHSMVAYVKE